MQTGEQARQEQARRDVAQSEIGERQQIMDHTNNLGIGPAFDRYPGRRIDQNDVVAACVDPRRRQPGQGGGVLIAVKSSFKKKALKQFQMTEIGWNIVETTGLVLDQPDARSQDADRPQETRTKLP